MYECSGCAMPTERSDLCAKIISFRQMGRGGRGQIVRQRTVEWLCTNCLSLDHVWSEAPYQKPLQKIVTE